MSIVNKRGVSPVVATTLLVSLVVILGVIIFLWARSVIPEVLTKGSGELKEPIENFCERIIFDALVQGDLLSITNNGDAPIYGFDVSLKSSETGSIEKLQSIEGNTVRGGESKDYTLSPEPIAGDELIIIPILLGESENEERKSFLCDSQYSQTITI